MEKTLLPFRKIALCAKDAFKPSLKTILFLCQVMIPVSLAVSLLDYFGVLAMGIPYIEPAMRLIGLPAEASLVVLSSVFLNIYSAIAVMETLTLSPREITILAIICLTAHNMIIETAIMKKTGSSIFKMLLIRSLWALASAWFFNLVLPPGPEVSFRTARAAFEPATGGLQDALTAWGYSMAFTIVKITLIVYLIMLVQKLMEGFGFLDGLSAPFNPFMRFFGLPRGLSYLWVVINVVGYAYGSGIILDQVDRRKMTFKESDLFNHHASVCHSLLEDTLLFLSIGVPLFWITLPRLAMAFTVVWFERMRRYLFMRGFRAGTM